MITRRHLHRTNPPSPPAPSPCQPPRRRRSDTNIDGRQLPEAHAHKRGLMAGCAVGATDLHDDAFTSVLAAQFSLVVAENAMKFGPIKPKPDPYFFDDADALVNFAQQHKIKVRGHNFVWHSSSPHGSRASPPKTTQEDPHRPHHDRRRPLQGQDAKLGCGQRGHSTLRRPPDGMRKSPWLELVGPDYIEMAFHTAHRRP